MAAWPSPSCENNVNNDYINFSNRKSFVSLCLFIEFLDKLLHLFPFKLCRMFQIVLFYEKQLLTYEAV